MMVLKNSPVCGEFCLPRRTCKMFVIYVINFCFGFSGLCTSCMMIDSYPLLRSVSVTGSASIAHMQVSNPGYAVYTIYA